MVVSFASNFGIGDLDTKPRELGLDLRLVLAAGPSRLAVALRGALVVARGYVERAGLGDEIALLHQIAV
jgi:hypothetical protein